MRDEICRVGSYADDTVNEYRINGNSVEFRIKRANGSQIECGEWTRLTNDDILMHLVLRTEVAKWLLARLEINRELFPDSMQQAS